MELRLITQPGQDLSSGPSQHQELPWETRSCSFRQLFSADYLSHLDRQELHTRINNKNNKQLKAPMKCFSSCLFIHMLTLLSQTRGQMFLTFVRLHNVLSSPPSGMHR